MYASEKNPAKIEIPNCNALTLVKKAYNNISKNYPSKECVMNAFYRETINREDYCLVVNEAILGIEKSPCLSAKGDRVAVRNARSNMPILSAGDSIMLKLQGGPYSSLMIDLVKHCLPGINKEFRLLNDKYMFWYGTPEYINGNPFITIEFDQRYATEDILYRGKIYVDPENYAAKDILCRGKIYIDPESYAIGRIEFNMNVEKRDDAYITFVRRKPISMHMDVNKAYYAVSYKKINGKWYFDNSETEVTFYVKWNKKHIDNKYTIKSQLAVSDLIADNDLSFEKEKILKRNQFLSEFAGEYKESPEWDLLNVTLTRLFVQKSLSPKSEILVD
jgi:hypothetical protein